MTDQTLAECMIPETPPWHAPDRVFVIRVACDKPVPDLGDFIGGRAWTIDGVVAVEIRELK